MVEAVQITRYQAADGMLFDTLAEAQLHETKDRLDDILERVAAYGGDVSMSQVVDVLVENAAEVIRILQSVTS